MEILVKNRGVDSSFFNGALQDLESHVNMRGMERGARLMADHLARGHKVVLVGDYDCDGITSVAQMALFLRDIGHTDFAVVIPTRAEGYGMPARAVHDHPDARLFVVMDCGTADVDSVSLARATKADCIVIDHHEVPAATDRVAPVSALINPKQPGCPSRFKEFCSSGLTLLFLTQLRRALQQRCGNRIRPSLGGKYLALAALATVADLVPLVEGNRIIARVGLGHINQGRCLPVQKVAELAGFAGKNITAGHLGYYIAPRINAPGRIADPALAFELLMAEDLDIAKKLAQELHQLNSRRQQLENGIIDVIRKRFAGEMVAKRTLVMADEGWHSGLVGIAASRVQQELLYGPTVLLAIDRQNGIARGSARSVPGFDVHAALTRCGRYLRRWGGHKMAAGLTLLLDQLEPFARSFEEVAQSHDAELFIPRGKVDLALDLNLVSEELVHELQQMEPHGLGNPSPLFVARGVQMEIRKTFGKDQNHLRLLLGDSLQSVFWKGVQHRQSWGWSNGDRMDAIFHLEWDCYANEPVAHIKDVGQFF
jgi:single-stranded-DNA-specific exonuclease